MCPKEHEQKAATQPARKEKEKEKENERSSRRASVSRSKTTPLRVEKKVDRDALCRSWGPKKPSAAKRDRCGIAYLDGPSEIRTGSPGAWTRHRNGSKHPVLFISMPGQRRPLPCLGKKRGALAAATEGKVVRCIARGPSRRQAPHASVAQSPLVPAQPPGPGIRVQSVPHLSQQAGKGAVRPA